MTLHSLITLQAVELDLRRLRAEAAELPRRVAAAQATLTAAEAALAQVRTALAREEALRRSQELELASQGDKIRRLVRQLDAATTQAQITALDHELTFARAAAAKLEDEELASMERTEAQEAAVGSQKEALENAAAALQSTQATAGELAARNSAAIAALDDERARLRKELLNPGDSAQATAPASPDALALYERVARSRGMGLAEARPDGAGGGQCGGCRMRVRPQRWQDLVNPARNPLAPRFGGGEEPAPLFTCESCGRLLFYDPRRDAPGEQPQIDRLRRAEAGSPASPSGT